MLSSGGKALQNNAALFGHVEHAHELKEKI